MKHKLQSIIFLQPIDQHFCVNKIQSQNDDISDNFNRNLIKLDCLDNSTESDSCDSKNEEYISASMKLNLRKISQIEEKSPKEKDLNFENSQKIKNYEIPHLKSKKNFHVPNFLLFDSEEENSDYINDSKSTNLYYNSVRDSQDLFYLKNSYLLNDDIENYQHFNNFSKNKFTNSDKIINFDKNVNKKNKITDLIDGDWKSKINAQKFLKFNAIKKKVVEKNIKNQNKKKNKNNINDTNIVKSNFNNNIISQFKISNSILNVNNFNNFSNFNDDINNLIINQQEIKNGNINLDIKIKNSSNERKLSKNLNLYFCNQSHNQKHINCSIQNSNFTSIENIPRFDIQPNQINNNNFRKYSIQNPPIFPINNFLLNSNFFNDSNNTSSVYNNFYNNKNIFNNRSPDNRSRTHTMNFIKY